jgi:hypothetical protein
LQEDSESTIKVSLENFESVKMKLTNETLSLLGEIKNSNILKEHKKRTLDFIVLDPEPLLD